jgi:hypothetical protein
MKRSGFNNSLTLFKKPLTFVDSLFLHVCIPVGLAPT